MTADEMFKELGYELVDRYTDRISYERRTPKGDIEAIDFPLNQTKPQHFAIFLNGKFIDVSIDELPAINKKVEELGWYEQDNKNEDKQYTKSRITTIKNK